MPPEPLPGPLVPPKWAAALAGGGLGLAVLAQFAPPDLRLALAACASVAVYAGTGELPQPGIVKRLGALVPAALVPGLGLLATGAHAWAVDAHQPLLHVLGTTLAVVAGTAEQPTVRVPPGLKSLALALLAAGALQGCAHHLASGPPAHELLAEAPAPAPAPEALPERSPAECRRLDDARLFWGVWAKICGTLTGGAGAGAIATAGDAQRVVGGAGLGLLACAVATQYLETELAVRHTAQCGR